jgi:sensor histidine kinase YesM
MIGAWASAALTPGVLWLGRRWPIVSQRWGRHLALHLAGSFIFSLLQLVIEAVVSVQIGLWSAPSVQTFGGLFPVIAVAGFHGNVLSYWAIIGMQAGWHYYRQYQQREQDALHLEVQTSSLKTELVRARLSALKMQLQPHFLFNTLNAVVALIRQQRGREAEDMLARLSDLLRWVLNDVEDQEVPLWRELDYLALYLAIEEVRFPDRLRIDIDVDPSLMEACVPHLGLQPIVENAIRHGIERSPTGGHIGISAIRTSDARTGDILTIAVTDDGPGFSGDGLTNGRGIGLANTRSRLHQLYGDAATLTTGTGDAGGARVMMTLPYRVADERTPEHEREPAHEDEDATDHARRR